MALVEQVQGQLEVQDRSVAAGRQLAAELAEEQLVGGGACWCGDVSCYLCAAADSMMDVVAQVGSQVAAVGQDVQRDARERKEGGDLLRRKFMLLTVSAIGTSIL